MKAAGRLDKMDAQRQPLKQPTIGYERLSWSVCIDLGKLGSRMLGIQAAADNRIKIKQMLQKDNKSMQGDAQ